MEEETDSISEKNAELAKSYFKEGLNCAESVLLSFLETHETHLPKEMVALCTGFGMGIGQTRNICGAIVGVVMALGAMEGRQDPFRLQTPSERAKEIRGCYPKYAKIVRDIEEKYGSLICSEISSAHGDFDSKPRKKNCQEIVGYCAAMASKFVDEENI